MGQYNKAIITAAGENLIARAVVGEIQLTITKAKASDYKYPDDTNFKALTDMDGIKQVLDYPETKVLDNNMIQTRVLFSNEEIQAAYYIQNIGLYAKDGEEEILFCIVTAKTPDEMPKYHGVASTSYIYNIQNVVQDAAEINIEVVPSGVATIQDVVEKVDATGGDISETVIRTLESIDTKYPVPVAGETTKVFMGKVKKFIEDSRPLDNNFSVYVAKTGSDSTGTGESSAPYKTINYALSKIPKMMNGVTAFIIVSEGTYNEELSFVGHIGNLQLLLAGDITVGGISISNASVSCKSTNTTARTLTAKWFNITDGGKWSSLSTINIITNNAYTLPDSSSVSIYAHVNCVVYMSGTVTLTGNTGIGVYVVASSKAYFGTITGTKFTTGIFMSAGCEVTCSKNTISSINSFVTENGSVIVSPYGSKIGTLSSDTILYVASTGSDTTGDGTSSKPFRTIQFAINTLPKDLGGHIVSIYIAGGTYDEDVCMSGFYAATGRIMVYLFGDIIIRSLTASGSHVIFTSSDTTSRNIKTGYLLVQDTATLNMWASINLGTTGYVIDPLTTTDKMSIGITRNSTLYLSGITTITGNDRVGVFAANMSQAYIYSVQGSGLHEGIFSVTGSHVTIYNNLISASSPYAQTHGGMFTYANGTQISGMITSGISCNWGTMYGGYIRHGNFNGTAMVTCNIHISMTSTLSAGSNYYVTGFPKPVGVPALAVSTNAPSRTLHCALNSEGSLEFTPATNTGPGEWREFSFTYLTNS